MKDLTEAMLIEMERRADALVEDLDHDLDAQAVAGDVAELCAHIRARVTP